MIYVNLTVAKTDDPRLDSLSRELDGVIHLNEAEGGLSAGMVAQGKREETFALSEASAAALLIALHRLTGVPLPDHLQD